MIQWLAYFISFAILVFFSVGYTQAKESNPPEDELDLMARNSEHTALVDAHLILPPNECDGIGDGHDSEAEAGHVHVEH